MTDNRTLCMDACGETGEVVLRSTEPVIRRAEGGAAYEALLHAGRMISNCAFNLAQRKPGEFTERDIQSLETACKAWDAAQKGSQ